MVNEKQYLNREFMRCEANRMSAQSLVKEQAAELETVIENNQPASCDAQVAKVRLARQELANTQVQLQQQRELVSELESQLPNPFANLTSA